MKKLLIGIGFSACVITVAFFFSYNSEVKQQFRTETVMRGDIVETVTASGIVNPVNTVLVGTQVSGTIKRIYADFNSHVKKGQLIAEIDPAIFEAELEQKKANRMKAEANLEKSKANLMNATRDFERKRRLFANEIIPKSEFDTSETTFISAKAQVAASKAEVAQSEAALKRDEANLRYTRIISPVNGIVIERNVNVGQTVAASFQTPTLFTIAEDLTQMQIDTNVDEADIGKIKAEHNVEFTVDAYENETFKGRVSQVRIAPIIVENVVTYNVVIIVDNADLRLKPGMTATVSIIINRKINVLLVPNAALRFTYDISDQPVRYKSPGIWMLRDGRPERVEIEKGIQDDNNTEILSGNVQEGEQAIFEHLTNSGAKSQNRRRRGFL